MPRALFVVILAAFGWAVGGRAVAQWVPRKLDGRAAPSAASPLVDLGEIRIPDDAPDENAHVTTFRTSRRGPIYRISLVMSDDARNELQARFDAYAQSVGYEPAGDDGSTTTNEPESCHDGTLGCVYREVLAEDDPVLRPIADRFQSVAGQLGLGREELARIVIAFVQAQAYRDPREEPFDVLPPGLVAFEGWGDCDSRSVLAAGLLKMVGIDAVVLESDSIEHAVIGVDLPTNGTTIERDGRTYACVEMTSPMPIGELSSDAERSTWSIVDV